MFKWWRNLRWWLARKITPKQKVVVRLGSWKSRNGRNVFLASRQYVFFFRSSEPEVFLLCERSPSKKGHVSHIPIDEVHRMIDAATVSEIIEPFIGEHMNGYKVTDVTEKVKERLEQK